MIDQNKRFIVTKEEMGDLALEMFSGFRLLQDAGFAVSTDDRERLVGALMVKRASGAVMPRSVVDWMIRELALEERPVVGIEMVQRAVFATA